MPTISNIFLFLYVDYLNKRMLLALCNPPTSRDVTLYAFCHVLYDCFENMSGCVSKGIIICVAVIVANKKKDDTNPNVTFEVTLFIVFYVLTVEQTRY